METNIQSLTFALSDVEIAATPIPETDYRSAVEKRASGRVMAWYKRAESLIPTRMHAFVYAVHQAFADHRPLVISPDHIWLLICQGFALHVQENAEALRPKLVTHSGKKDIIIIEPENLQWEKVISTFSQEVRKNLITDLYATFTPHFSTTTPVETTAFEISLLDTVKEYFALTMTWCGIPSITIEGSPDDWRTLQKHLRQLSVFDLDWWVKQVDPIIDEFIYTSEGRFNKSFWENFYKYESRSGSTSINGWLVRLFPYARYQHMLDFRTAKPATWKYAINPYFDDSLPEGSFSLEHVPSGLVRAPFTWERVEARYEMNLISGFMGVRQNPETKALRPEISWAIQDTKSIVETVPHL